MTLWMIAIVGCFLAGLVGRALAPSKRGRRWVVLAALIFAGSAVLHVPLTFDVLQSGFPSFGWEALVWLAGRQAIMMLFVCATTGAGWLLASFIKAVFEDQPD
jgi:hypothetical protein